MKKRLSLSRIFKQRDKLLQAAKPYIGARIVAATFQDFIADIYRVLPNYVSHDAVFESCRPLAGYELTSKSASVFAWLIAGNVDLLISGVPVVPWVSQAIDEWIPVQVTQVDATARRDNPGFLFTCRALAGAYCPGVFEQFLSRASCAAVARTVGFSRNMPHTNSAYFTSLRFWAFIEVAKSKEQPQFQQIDCAPAMREHNRRILALRTRHAPCPKEYEHLCEHCPVGYGTCRGSLYARGLELRMCSGCNTSAYFDLARSDALCFQCWRVKNFRHVSGA